MRRQVRLLQKGHVQWVQIPREFQLRGKRAVIRKEGDRLILEPELSRSLLAVLAMLPTLDEDFSAIDDCPPENGLA